MRLKRLLLLPLFTLLFSLVGSTSKTNPIAYPNPAAATITPSTVTSTSTFAKRWEVTTSTPISTADPNFLSGTLATIAKNNALNYSDEDLFKVW